MARYLAVVGQGLMLRRLFRPPCTREVCVSRRRWGGGGDGGGGGGGTSQVRRKVRPQLGQHNLHPPCKHAAKGPWLLGTVQALIAATSN